MMMLPQIYSLHLIKIVSATFRHSLLYSLIGIAVSLIVIGFIHLFRAILVGYLVVLILIDIVGR